MNLIVLQVVLLLAAVSQSQETTGHNDEVHNDEGHNGEVNQSETRNLVVINTEIDVFFKGMDPNESSNEKSCITETGLDLSKLVMAPTKTFKEQTLEECVLYCLNNWPANTHVLISYYKAIIMGSQFNCMCATKDAFVNSTGVSEQLCRKKCPSSNYRCGDPKNNLLSVYCLQESCSNSDGAAICSRQLPHDIHGCIKGDFLDWRHGHNVRNFTSTLNDDSACVWECKDNHPRSMYAITRITGEILTCSCGYGRLFDPSLMVVPQFCGMIDKQIEKSNYYHVNCVSDINPNVRPIINGSVRCDEVTSVGCMFEDLVAKSNQMFSLKLPEQTNPAKDFDVMKCVQGCSILFTMESYFAGIRLDTKENELVCHCLNSGAFNMSTIGPSAVCNQNCGPIGSGLLCGSSDDKHHRALSLYCIPDEIQEKSSTRLVRPTRQATNRDASVMLDQSLMSGYLVRIDEAIDYNNFTTEIIIALLIMFCLFLLLAVIYLWQARGVSSLSRQVM